MANNFTESFIVALATALLMAGLVLFASAVGEVMWSKPAIYILFGGIFILLSLLALFKKITIRQGLTILFGLAVIMAFIVVIFI